MQTIYIHSFTSKATSQLIKCQISADSVPQIHDFTLHNMTIIPPIMEPHIFYKVNSKCKASPTPPSTKVFGAAFVNIALDFSPDKGGIPKR